MKKFEQVSSDNHQMSVAKGIGYPGFHVTERREGGAWVSQVICLGLGVVPYHVTYPMMHVMLRTYPHPVPP